MGFEDETWFSRFERPSVHSWEQAGRPMRFLQKEATKDDPDPKALSCYGLYLPELEQTWLRFVDGRPVSAITTQFLGWCCHKLHTRGKKALLLIWDNASWHKSREVHGWITAHNRKVKENNRGVRIVPCFLPTRSPWLNAIEPKWIHGKRKVVEPEGVLGAYELADRVCGVFGCPHYEHLSIPQEVA
ncbi:MAG TPA: transposase [Rubrobacter sp.]